MVSSSDCFKKVITNFLGSSFQKLATRVKSGHG